MHSNPIRKKLIYIPLCGLTFFGPFKLNRIVFPLHTCFDLTPISMCFNHPTQSSVPLSSAGPSLSFCSLGFFNVSSVITRQHAARSLLTSERLTKIDGQRIAGKTSINASVN